METIRKRSGHWFEGDIFASKTVLIIYRYGTKMDAKS